MSDSSRPKRRRRGSREAMLAKRSKPPAINPAPAGPRGGQYRPLTDTQVEQIYDTSMRILAELGMGDSPEVLTEQALKCGATLNDLGRLCFSRDMVEDIVDGFENMPNALARLYNGDNVGVQLCRVREEPAR